MQQHCLHTCCRGQRGTRRILPGRKPDQRAIQNISRIVRKVQDQESKRALQRPNLHAKNHASLLLYLHRRSREVSDAPVFTQSNSLMPIEKGGLRVALFIRERFAFRGLNGIRGATEEEKAGTAPDIRGVPIAKGINYAVPPESTCYRRWIPAPISGRAFPRSFVCDAVEFALAGAQIDLVRIGPPTGGNRAGF